MVASTDFSDSQVSDEDKIALLNEIYRLHWTVFILTTGKVWATRLKPRPSRVPANEWPITLEADTLKEMADKLAEQEPELQPEGLALPVG
jgi:hypothetical protein